MLLLTSTSDLIQVVTSAAANVLADAEYLDASGPTTVTPGRTDTAAITSATTTTVVGSPGSSVQRAVETLSIRNTSNSATTKVKVQHYDGTLTNDISPNVTLLPGECLRLDEYGRWRHLDSMMSPYAPKLPTIRPSLSGYLAESIPRELTEAGGGGWLSSGSLSLQAIWLKAGTVVSNISFCSGAQAAASPTDWFFCLYDMGLNLRAQSADQLTTAWAAQTLVTLAMQTPYTVPADGFYYLGAMMAAATVVNFKGSTPAAQTLQQVYPPLSGRTLNSGLTTALPNPCLPPTTVLTLMIWGAVT